MKQKAPSIMTLKSLLWMPLALASATSQAQPIDQSGSVTLTVDRSVQTEFDEMRAMQIKDLNGDDRADIIWASSTGIYQAYGNGEGGFDSTMTLYANNPSAPRVANNSFLTLTNPALDLNQDGIQGYVSMLANPAVSSAVSRITFFVSNPANSRMDEYSFPEVPLTYSDYHLQDYVDIDNNGQAELVTLGGEYTGGHYNAKLKTFDVTLDSSGIPTAVTTQKEHTFVFSAGASGFYLELADMNGDDKLDAVFVVLNDTDTTDIDLYDKTYADLVIYYQQDNLTWSAPSVIKQDMIFFEYGTIQYLISDTHIEVADLDGNGRKDIVTFNTGLINNNTISVDRYANIVVFWQETDGTFSEGGLPGNYFWDISYPREIKISDIDSDGIADITYHGISLDIDNFLFTGQYVWQRNLGDRTFSDVHFLSEAGVFLQPELSAITDLNGDSQTDLLMSGVKVTDIDSGSGPSGLFYINPDIFPPQATLSAAASTHMYSAFDITIETNETVTGLNANSVTLSGASLSNWQEIVAGSTYRFTATPSTPMATVVASIATESFVDASNIGNRTAHEITVNANIRPQINNPADMTITSGEALSFTPTVTDPDSTNLTYALMNAPQWLAINPVTGELTGTPTADDIDTYAGIRISVSDGSVLDGEAAVLSAPFAISVKANNPDADGDGIADELEDGDYNGDGINDSLQQDPGIDSGIGGGAIAPWLLLLLLPLTLMSQAARAESAFKQFDFKNTYAGVIASKSYLTPDDDNSGWKQQNQWHSGLGFNIGYQFHADGFAEFHYLSAGEVTFANRNPNIPGEPTLSYSTLSLLGGYYLNQHNQYRGYVRSGISQLKTDGSNSLNNDQQSNLVVPFGAGVELVLEPNWNLRIGADYYSEDIQNLYLNLKYQH